MRALVTGATGFIGRSLLGSLHHPVVVTRDPDRARARLGDVRVHRWEPLVGPAPREAFEGVDAVFNLMGEPLAPGRWSDARKELIRRSRLVGTRNLVAGIAAAGERPKVLVSASAVGFYGSPGEEVVDEAAKRGEGFLAQLCADWEKEARKAEALGVRVVHLRIGVVLGPQGGALAQMLVPFRMGVGGRLGAGRQWMSWVHLDDVVGLAHFAATGDLKGPVNAVSPEPARNADFTRALARTLGRPAVIPAPGFALRLALGEFAGVLLGSIRAAPVAALAAGYRFRHPSLEEALRASIPS